MKLSKWIYGIAAAGVLAACSSNDMPENPGIQGESVPDGYIAVNLCLPTNNGTRANDKFDDGEENEYAVKNGVLVLFKGEDEGSAVYCGAYSLGLTEFAPGDTENGNVTTTYRRAVEVKGLNLTGNDKLYGLALINYDLAGFTLKENSGLKVSTADGEFDFTSSTTFATLLGKISSLPFYKSNALGNVAESIFMTNSPLVIGTPGGQNEVPAEVKIQTLVDLTGGIKPSEEEALNSPAGTIYVERAVAKVQCSSFLPESPLTENGLDTGIEVSDGNGKKKLYVKNIQWGISNQEENSYIVRNVDGIDWSLHSESLMVEKPYRMVGFTGMRQNMDIMWNEETNPYLYRPYWGIDPNYDNDKPLDSQFHNLLAWNGSQVFYPHENTFSVEFQNYHNTTRVGFWVTFALGEDGSPITFYTRGKDKSTFYFNRIENEKVIDPLMSDVIAELSENELVRNAWINALDRQEPGSASWVVDEYLKIETNDMPSGALEVTSIAFNADKASIYKDGKLPEFDFSDLIDEFNSKYTYYQYVDGKAFYDVMIKHFGDDLTPWIDEGSASTIDESYPKDNRDNNYLGRYGLLRNNWYDIQVDKLLDLGEPRDPATWEDKWGDTPDDNKAQYIAVRIAILSWAKRTQSVEF